jgi:hypothetical protein
MVVSVGDGWRYAGGCLYAYGARPNEALFLRVEV